MSMLDKMRAKQGLLSGTAKEQQAPPKPQEMAKQPPKAAAQTHPVKEDKPGKKKDYQAIGKITYKCGHVANIKPDHDCQGCRNKTRRENNIAHQAAFKDAKTPDGLPNLRLPEGSVYHKVYNAKAVMWDGTLTIPKYLPTGEDLVFTTQASGSWRVELSLDRLWRQWLKENKGEASGSNKRAVVEA